MCHCTRHGQPLDYVMTFERLTSSCSVLIQVKFRPVFWGLALQFLFALLILRTTWGYSAFEWLGERVSEFLAHTDAGSSFVFGNTLVFGDEKIAFFSVFAFKVTTYIAFLILTMFSIIFFYNAPKWRKHIVAPLSVHLSVRPEPCPAKNYCWDLI